MGWAGQRQYITSSCFSLINILTRKVPMKSKNNREVIGHSPWETTTNQKYWPETK